MKKILGTAFFVLVMMTTSQTVSAQALSPAERAERLTEIQRLLALLVDLQAQLAALETNDEAVDDLEVETVPCDDSITDYTPRTYSKSYEAIYCREGSELVRMDSSARERYGDTLLWSTYQELVGDDFLQTYNVNDWRIFSDTRSTIGAYVEEKPSGDWIVGVNRQGDSFVNRHDDDAMIGTLLHESAHVVFFTDLEYQAAFDEQFWSGEAGIERHLEEIQNAADFKDRTDIGDQYYERHESDFVTEYAASAPYEDIVESFVEFVTLDDEPQGSQTKNEKVRFFYQYPELVEWREELRDSGLI